MKKTLVALAALAVVGAASAQATLTGKVGFAYQGYSAKAMTATVAAARTQYAAAVVDAPLVAAVEMTGLAMTDATFNLGMTEDLGGGLTAAGSIGFDAGSAQFGLQQNRRNTSMSVVGGFGTVAFAQTRTTTLLQSAFLSPAVNYWGVVDSGIITRVATDSLTYTSPAIGSIKLSAGVNEMGTDGNETPAINGVGLGASYAAGPVGLAVAYKSISAGYKALTTGVRTNHLEAMASYDLGVAKVAVGFDGARANVLESATEGNAVSLSVSMPLGAQAVAGFDYATRDANTFAQYAIQYNLSKRTALNGSFGNLSNTKVDNVTTGNMYRIAIWHTF